jgi:hypothetical protein
LFTLPSALLQAKGQPSRPAKAITKAEFTDVMKEVQEEAIAALKPRHPRTSAVELQKKLAFSFDHHAVHECPKLLEEVAGIKASQRLTLPALSPDFQQPIEHAHGRFKQAMNKAILENPSIQSIKDMQSIVGRLWEKVNSKQVVAKDVGRLPKLYQFVLNTSDGGFRAEGFFLEIKPDTFVCCGFL